MIKANELRIGNYVQYNPDAVDKGTEIIPLQITAIDEEAGFILNDGFSNVYAENEVEPIPLSSELLEQCGFYNQKYEEWSAFAFKDTPICTHYDGVEWIFKYGYDSDLSFAACEYLHQVQNLIFVLTGEELSIDLSKLKL